jgi:pimeloyl-ACP methyl ester carboxylesterase
MDAKTISRNGVSLSYTDSGGSAPPIVFIHGWCCDGTYWREQLPEFARDHRVVALDLRGHGQSDKPDQDYTIAGFVDDVAWLCDEIKLDRPIVVGHSMGGMITLNLVRQRPKLARAAVLADPPIRRLPGAPDPVAQAILAGLRSPAYASVLQNLVQGFLFNADSDPGLKAEVSGAMSAAPQRVICTAFASIVAEAPSTAGPLPVASLFVRAATHTLSAEDIQALFPGVKVAEMDTAHFVMMERPDEFNAIVREFVSEVA